MIINPMKSTPFTSLFAFLLLVVPPLIAQNPGAEVEERITISSMASHIQFLSDDLLGGRGVGTMHDELTRLYLRTQYQLLGLLPAGENETYVQHVPIVGITTTISKPLEIVAPSGKRAAFTAPADYTAEIARPVTSVEWDQVPMVFVGYGITAPEENWDDFKGVDVKGKILLVMNNDPSSDDSLFAGKTRLYYGRWSYKFEEAARRGAVGAIVIHTTESAGYPFQVIQTGQGQEQFWLPFREEDPTLAIRSWCSEEAARLMCSLGGQDLDDLRARAEKRDFVPVTLPVRASLSGTATSRTIPSGNVLGMLPGSDPELKDEVVVVTAHFDHLGKGREVRGDSIYNGALDNASGCSAMLNLARALSLMKTAPKRSILFAAVTAEESGLLGSKYFAENPTVPRKKMIANYNIDGINIWGVTKDLGMVGHGKNSLTALAEQVAARRGRVIKPDQEADKGLFYRSDHFSFARIGVPAAYFKAGGDFLENGDTRRSVKGAYTNLHYHQPSDQIDERWNLAGAVEDTRLILECLLHTANAKEAPTWTAGDEFEKLR